MIEINLVKFWESLGKDMQAVRDRVRNLIGGRHWLTDGVYKEILLKHAIERHLPENLKVCTGFICKTGILDENK